MIVTVCAFCGRSPEEIGEYVEQARLASEDEGRLITPSQFVAAEEGTLNPENGHFACTECYIEIGMPTTREGWKAP